MVSLLDGILLVPLPKPPGTSPHTNTLALSLVIALCALACVFPSLSMRAEKLRFSIIVEAYLNVSPPKFSLPPSPPPSRAPTSPGRKHHKKIQPGKPRQVKPRQDTTDSLPGKALVKRQEPRHLLILRPEPSPPLPRRPVADGVCSPPSIRFPPLPGRGRKEGNEGNEEQREEGWGHGAEEGRGRHGGRRGEGGLRRERKKERRGVGRRGDEEARTESVAHTSEINDCPLLREGHKDRESRVARKSTKQRPLWFAVPFDQSVGGKQHGTWGVRHPG